MIKRPTLVMLALFALVLSFAWYWQSTKDERQASDATPSAVVENLLTIDSASVAKLTIESSTGERLALRRDELGYWKMTEPENAATDIGAVESAITQLASIRVVRSLDPASDMNVFGLVDPLFTISVVMADSQMHTLLVGNVNATGNSYYVRLNGEAPQLVNKASLDPVLGMLTNPPYEPTATPALPIDPNPVTTPTLNP